jgi:hypothetical protein
MVEALWLLEGLWCRGRCFDKLSMTNRGADTDGPRQEFGAGACFLLCVQEFVSQAGGFG